MKKNAYEAIIFDLGGVLLDLDYQRTIIAFENLGKIDFNTFYSQQQQTLLFDQFETGKIGSLHFINQLKRHLPTTATPNQIVHAWNAMILDFRLEKIELLVKLSKSHRLFLLSNTNDIHMEKVRRELAKISALKLEDLFTKVYLSQEIGMRKPHPETFQYVCDDAKLNPSTTLFIDDSEQHILGAKSIGLQTNLHPQNQPLDYLFS